MRLIIGKVRSGKTSLIIEEIRNRVENRDGKTLLLVPEQYSHEAERELCAACGCSMSLFAEVMSFTGFARWGRAHYGGNGRPRMDEGGKLLCMSLALRELQPVLKRYALAGGNPDLQKMILEELNGLQAASADTGALKQLSDTIGGSLGEKLSELSLIKEAYQAQIERAGCSSEDPLSLLSRQLEQYGQTYFDRIYVDGFVDFTGQELSVLRTLLRQKTELTVCFTGEESVRGEEYYLLSRMAMNRLKEAAEEAGVSTECHFVNSRTGSVCKDNYDRRPASAKEAYAEEKNSNSESGIWKETVHAESEKQALRYFSDHMFDYAAEPYGKEQNEIRLVSAQNPREECEAAAAMILDAVRQDGCRWRDIAVAVRGFEDYRVLLEHTFRRYEIPLYLSERTPLMEKVLPLWIETAYDIILGNWNPEDVSTWLRCGLSGLDTETVDLLCAYIARWKIHGSAWLRKERWNQHPNGYGQKYTEDTERILDRIDFARRRAADALICFSRATEEAETARSQGDALLRFLQDCEIPERLRERAQRLREDGKLQLSSEYTQIWELSVKAVLQIQTILGDTPMKTEDFRAMLHNVLATYDIGTIPPALDRVSAGDFDRMRRRNIRRLFVLGCTDERLPRAQKRVGLFTAEERNALADHDLTAGGEAELWREYSVILHTLSLPHEQLTLFCPASGFQGSVCIPASVFSRAEKLFSIKPEPIRPERCRLSARAPALLLAAAAAQPPASDEEIAAECYFRTHDPKRLETIINASRRRSEKLSEKAVRALYGGKLRISPSKLENFIGCRFRYYCNYGLRAETEEPAEFQAPEIGSYVHRILEQTAKKVSELGGFRAVSNEMLRDIANEYIGEYIHNELHDFEEKNARFRHLFERLTADLHRIVEDTAEELRKSDFRPISFELDISDLDSSDEQDEALLTGIADRVDGWIQDGQIYLRIVDYKTGKKKFGMSDIWYCRNLQMLMYLFAVCDDATELYGLPGIPAGIIYLPAREDVLRFDSKPDDTEKEKLRIRGKRRSGLVLANPGVLEAWENGNDSVYLPEKTRSSNPFVTSEQMKLLRRHVRNSLKTMAEELRSGEIEPNPEYVSETKNACVFCDYRRICRFEEGVTGYSRPTPPLTDEEVWDRLKEPSSTKEQIPERM